MTRPSRGSGHPGSLTAIIDHHLQELAHGKSIGSRRIEPCHRGGVESRRQRSPVTEGSASPSPDPHWSKSRSSGSGVPGRPPSRKSSPNPKHSDEQSRALRTDSRCAVPSDRRRAQGEQSYERLDSRGVTCAARDRGQPSGGTPLLRKAHSERSLLDPQQGRSSPSRSSTRDAPSASGWNVRSQGYSFSDAHRDEKVWLDDTGLKYGLKYQPLSLKSRTGARDPDDESFALRSGDGSAGHSFPGQPPGPMSTAAERAQWLQVEVSELYRKREEMESLREEEAKERASLEAENERLKKEKEQMETVFCQLKDQWRDEKAETELQHEREMQELRQEILEQKAQLARQQERHDETIKRTVLARKSDKRYTEQTLAQLCEVRDRHRIALSQHSEEMSNLTADLNRVIRERDLLQATAHGPGGGGERSSSPSSSIRGRLDPGVRQELATLRLRCLVLKRALRSQDYRGQGATESVAAVSAATVPSVAKVKARQTTTPSALMEMFAQERELMERKYEEHFALLISAVGKQQNDHSNTQLDFMRSTEDSAIEHQAGSPMSTSPGSTAPFRDPLERLRRENEEVRRRWGI